MNARTVLRGGLLAATTALDLMVWAAGAASDALGRIRTQLAEKREDTDAHR